MSGEVDKQDSQKPPSSRKFVPVAFNGASTHHFCCGIIYPRKRDLHIYKLYGNAAAF